MESHPLSLAHQQHRRAEAHLIYNRFDEAMQCHHNAAELLLDAMKSTASSVALESISLQHSYHLKQKDLIRTKKEQFSRVKKAMDNIKWLSKEQLPDAQSNDYSKLQVAIYKAINENDSLLHMLLNQNASSETGLLEDTVAKIDISDGKKTEKTQQTVVEELQILSQNLHSLVEQLVFQVEVLKDENSTLKDRVTYLEKERIKYLNLSSIQGDIMTQRNKFAPDVSHNEAPPKETSERLPVISNYQIERPTQKPYFDLSALKDD